MKFIINKIPFYMKLFKNVRKGNLKGCYNFLLGEFVFLKPHKNYYDLIDTINHEHLHKVLRWELLGTDYAFEQEHWAIEKIL